MARRSTVGYTGYQGRRPGGGALKLLLALLVTVLLLVAVALLVGQRYIVYTDEGVRLELPFARQEQTPPEESASHPVDIVRDQGTYGK